MAFRTVEAAPNLICEGLGHRQLFDVAPSPLNATSANTEKFAARSIVFRFTGDNDVLPKRIHYSVEQRLLTGTNPGQNFLGRIAVIRNYPFDVSKILFDPWLTDNVPFVNNAGVSDGNTWQQGGVTMPRFDWEAADIIFNRYIKVSGTTPFIDWGEINLNFQPLQSNENLLVVLTPMYLDRSSFAIPNSNADLTLGWTNVGVFVGSRNAAGIDSIGQAHLIRYASMTVEGKDC